MCHSCASIRLNNFQQETAIDLKRAFAFTFVSRFQARRTNYVSLFSPRVLAGSVTLRGINKSLLQRLLIYNQCRCDLLPLVLKLYRFSKEINFTQEKRFQILNDYHGILKGSAKSNRITKIYYHVDKISSHALHLMKNLWYLSF